MINQFLEFCRKFKLLLFSYQNYKNIPKQPSALLTTFYSLILKATWAH